MSYSETLDYLYALRHHGIKLGLENPRKLISLSGNPQRAYHIVHVAGTNGKGSTVSMIASVLKAAGIRTGTFTSPHLVSFTERIQVDGERISEEDVLRLAVDIRERVESAGDLNPTFFEFVTAMALIYFREQGVEWAVVETGMGGRFDATNVISPDITVITPVGLDHREFLGETLKEIAYEKAGIIKEGVPLVLAPQAGDALNTILKAAKGKNAPVYKYGDDFRAEIQEMTQEGVRFDYMSSGLDSQPATRNPQPATEIKGLFTPLTGSCQAINGAVAVRTAEIVLKSYKTPVDDIPGVIRSGLSCTYWPGRCELVDFKGMPVLMDGAHNPEAAHALSETLRNLYLSSHTAGSYDSLILIFGAMADKDIKEILSPLLPLARVVIFTSPSYGRSEKPETLLRIGRGQVSTFNISPDSSPAEDKGKQLCQMLRPDPSFYAAPNIKEALELAGRLYRRGDLVVVTGSFYTVGEAREAMGEKAVLAKLREHR
ncbi:MAG: bifunctional folylpolyglutamate synthase/dihydrofolate synthase [Nitrospirae bacterium]|nr:bifunctional folylpolyglutamate synthase/dihydrofolate synthase [Nitrospirota bacterium]